MIYGKNGKKLLKQDLMCSSSKPVYNRRHCS